MRGIKTVTICFEGDEDGREIVAKRKINWEEVEYSLSGGTEYLRMILQHLYETFMNSEISGE